MLFRATQWSEEPLPPEGRFGAEVQRRVKEELFQEVVGLFDRGQAWEHGIPLCKELCAIYEEEFEYEKLAKTLVRAKVIVFVLAVMRCVS